MARFIKYCCLFLLPVLACCIAISLRPLDKRFAFRFVEGECAGHAKWIYDRLYENNAPIDIAFIGSSVGWGVFDDKTLSHLLADSLSEPVTVANISFCRPGMNIRTLLVEEVIRTKKLRHIVLELRSEPNMGGIPPLVSWQKWSLFLFPQPCFIRVISEISKTRLW